MNHMVNKALVLCSCGLVPRNQACIIGKVDEEGKNAIATPEENMQKRLTEKKKDEEEKAVAWMTTGK